VILKSMKTQVKVLRQVVHNKSVKSNKTSRVVHGSGASARPIGDRMAAFMQLQGLERDMRAKENEISALHKQITPGRIGRVAGKGKEIAGKSLEEFFKFGGRRARRICTNGPLPQSNDVFYRWVWIPDGCSFGAVTHPGISAKKNR
jgi:hypothetical protein